MKPEIDHYCSKALEARVKDKPKQYRLLQIHCVPATKYLLYFIMESLVPLLHTTSHILCSPQKLFETGYSFLAHWQTSLRSRNNKILSKFEHQNLPLGGVFSPIKHWGFLRIYHVSTKLTSSFFLEALSLCEYKSNFM